LTDDLHDSCAKAARLMVAKGITRNVSYIFQDDAPEIKMPNGMILKVTIEWCNASEADAQP
jgi:hypothetical protein